MRDLSLIHIFQGRGVILVRRISGDYSSVVGLPVARVGRILRALGV